MYLQYFLGNSSYIKEAPFDPSLFVDIRKRLGHELVAEMNKRILGFSMQMAAKKEEKRTGANGDGSGGPSGGDAANRGYVIYDATVCP